MFFLPADKPSDGLNIVCAEDKLYVKCIEFDILTCKFFRFLLTNSLILVRLKLSEGVMVRYM